MPAGKQKISTERRIGNKNLAEAADKGVRTLIGR